MNTQTDWRYSEDRMLLRAEAFVKLKAYFKLETVRYLYEFCHDWISQGNQNTDNIERYFLQYLELNR